MHILSQSPLSSELLTLLKNHNASTEISLLIEGFFVMEKDSSPHFKIIETPNHSVAVDGGVIAIHSSGIFHSSAGEKNVGHRVRTEQSLEIRHGKNEDQGTRG